MPRKLPNDEVSIDKPNQKTSILQLDFVSTSRIIV